MASTVFMMNVHNNPLLKMTAKGLSDKASQCNLVV